MAKSYWEKLQDPRWQRKRLEVLANANFRCEACGDSEETLHVHHGFYAKGREPWDYPNESLHALCKTCHESRQSLQDTAHETLALMDADRLRAATDVIDLMANMDVNDLDCLCDLAADYMRVYRGVGEPS